MRKLPAIIIGLIATTLVNINTYASQLNCNFTGAELRDATYTYITVKKDLQSALDSIAELKKCDTSNTQKAQLADYAGEVYFALYKSTKTKKYATQAEKLYTQSISYNTTHNEVTYLHLALLYRELKLYEIAIQTINKLLKLKPKEPRDALSVALITAVDVKNWEQAKSLVDILINKDRAYYVRIPATLAPSIQTLCHFQRKSVAEIFVNNVEKHSGKLSESDKIYLDKSKELLKSCS